MKLELFCRCGECFCGRVEVAKADKIMRKFFSEHYGDGHGHVSADTFRRISNEKEKSKAKKRPESESFSENSEGVADGT
jgi:hypothetical protein